MALITGSQGFVGKYLRRELEENGYEVLGIDLQAGPDTIQADLLAPEQMKEVVSQTKPNAVFHLAGQADVARSWKNSPEDYGNQCHRRRQPDGGGAGV